MTKYGIEISEEIIATNIKRLTNQLWKLIPMRENEENWLNQLETVIIEIVGLKEIFLLTPSFLVLLSKLEGLKAIEDLDFALYRKTVFECITLLREIR
jgi:hypothetical protein